MAAGLILAGLALFSAAAAPAVQPLEPLSFEACGPGLPGVEWVVGPDGAPQQLVLLATHPTDRGSEAAAACVLETMATARFPLEDAGRVGVFRIDDDGRPQVSWTVRPFPRRPRPSGAPEAVLVGLRALGSAPLDDVTSVSAALQTDALDGCRVGDEEVDRVVSLVVDGVVRRDRFVPTRLLVLDEVVGPGGRLRPRVDPALFPVRRGCVRRALNGVRLAPGRMEGARFRVRWTYGAPTRLASDGAYATDRLVHVPPGPDAVALEAVDRRLRGRLRGMRACWADALRREQRPLHGGLTLGFRIDTTGLASNPTVSQSDLESAVVATCLTDLVGALRFAPPGEPRRVTYPLWFGPPP